MKLVNGDPSKIKHFDWDKAKNFYYIVKLGSFTEASQFLNISQSAISRQMSILENDLRCALLTRLPRGVKVTRKGEELFKIIESSFLQLKRFAHDYHVITIDGEKRKIRISTTHPVAAYILSDHLLTYDELHSDIIFEVFANDELIDLTINDVDIAIRPYDENATDVEQEYLFTLEKKLFASQKYIDKHGNPEKVEDLNKHKILAHAYPEKHPYADINWILKLGVTLGNLHNPVFISNSLECLVKAAQRDRGIIGAYENMQNIKQSGLKNILKNISDRKVEWCFTYPTYLKQDNYIQKFKNFLQEALISCK